MSHITTCPDCGNERWAGVGPCSDCGHEPAVERETEVVYELRLRVAGDIPPGLQVLNETNLISMAMTAAQAGDADDDAYVRIVGVEARRVQ